MTQQKMNRSKLLQVRVTPSEMESIKKEFSKSTCRKLSEYLRRKLTDKPIATYTRNQSLDEFMVELIRLNKELNAIGNNYNQVVKRLHNLQHLGELKAWQLTNESSRQVLLKKVDEIKTKITQINHQWLQ